MASKSIEWRVPDEPEEALSAFSAAQGPVIEKRGYRVDDERPGSLTYKRRHTFPAERFTVAATPSDGGSVITVEGKVHRKLRKSFAALAELPPAEPEPEIEELEPEVEELQPEAEELELELEPQEAPVVELASAQVNGTAIERVAPEAEQSPLLRQVRTSTLIAEGASRRLDAEANGEEIDCSEMRAELESIYSLAGHPEAFTEARGKVEVLAEELVLQAGCAPDEALYIAYLRSLAEHREYLAGKGISDPVAG